MYKTTFYTVCKLLFYFISDNDTLKSFIVGSKSIERAKAKIDAYYTARIRFTNPFFEKREPERIKWLKGEYVIFFFIFKSDKANKKKMYCY